MALSPRTSMFISLFGCALAVGTLIFTIVARPFEQSLATAYMCGSLFMFQNIAGRVSEETAECKVYRERAQAAGFGFTMREGVIEKNGVEEH